MVSKSSHIFPASAKILQYIVGELDNLYLNAAEYFTNTFPPS
jgi:hypothetical protein